MKRYFSKQVIILWSVILFANFIFIPGGESLLGKKALTVDLTYTVEEKNGKVKVSIKTNLPNGTYLMVSLGSKNNEKEKNYYMYQSVKVNVQGGKAETSWLDNSGQRLKEGQYDLSISTPLAEIQPENVQKRIGNKGQLLKGVHVDSSRGDNSRIVDLDEIIEIKGF